MAGPEGVVLAGGFGVVAGVGGRDPHTEFDPLPEPATERIGDLRTEVALDLVLDETAGHRQQREAFDDGEGFHQLEPRPLLRGQRLQRVAVFSIEFGDNVPPHGRECETGVIGQATDTPWLSGRHLPTTTETTKTVLST